MDKDVKDFKCYATLQQREMIKSTYEEMVELIPQFSKLQRVKPGLSFTEYSILYRDLFEFYNIDLMTRKSYVVKDILSFRNSFELILRRIKDVATLEHVTLQVFFTDKLEQFENWLSEIELIAINTVDRE